MPFSLNATELVKTETKLGCELPKAYRCKMLDDNGGFIAAAGDVWQLHPIRDASDKRRLKRSANDVFLETKMMQKRVGWPKGAICIATNGSGDALILQTQRRFLRTSIIKPEVFLWSHETTTKIKVANSFGDLTLQSGPNATH